MIKSRTPYPVPRTPYKAFTLVEIMVATAILSLGTVLIYEAFFISVNAFDYYSNYLSLAPKMDEKIWQAQNNLTCFGPVAYVQREGSFIKDNKAFGWNMSHRLIGSTKTLELYKIRFSLSWQEGERRLTLMRDAYAMYRKEE